VSALGTAALALALVAGGAAEAPRWPGVDEAVVGRVASAAGHERWRTFLDGTGDLPLFLFLCAGIVGGFALGYGYRALFARERHRTTEER
jgi:hypothetical protein